MPVEDSGTGGRRAVSTFADRLEELKTRGCAVLVAGADAERGHDELCGRLLGDGSVEPRRRVLVVTDDGGPLDVRLPTEGESVPDTTAVDATGLRRAASTATATTAAAVPRGVDVVEPDGGSLGALGVALTEAVDRVERRYAPLAPSELRIGIDSLAPLLDAHGEEQVFAFLAVATHYVRAADALGHVHLSVDRSAYVTRLLAPLFDVLVEVRARNGRHQQRWHLDEGEITSQWLTV